MMRRVLYLPAVPTDWTPAPHLPAGVELETQAVPTVAGGVRAAALRRLRGRRVDLVIAYGRDALPAAWIGGGKVLYLPDDRDSGDAGWVRRLGRRVEVAAAARAVAGRYGGVVHVVRPRPDGPGFGGDLLSGKRGEARRALGLPEDAFALLAPGPSTRAADHQAAVWAAALLRELDSRVRLLLDPGGPRAGAVRLFASRMARAGLVVDCPSPALGRAAADLAVLSATGPVDPTPILAAAASGLPVVATRGAVAAEFFPGGRGALVAADGTPRMLARRVLDYREGLRAAMPAAAPPGAGWADVLGDLLPA